MNQYRENEQQRENEIREQERLYRQNQYGRHESSDEIKADIEQTRAEMGAKIDRIKERMDPEQLKAQAQETAKEMMTDTANAISDYVRTNRQQITGSLVDTVKHNPLPAALIGVGIGWLVVDALSSDERSHQDYRYGYRSRSYSGPYGGRMPYERYGPGYDDVGYYYTERQFRGASGPYGEQYRDQDFDRNRNWAEEKAGEAKAQAGQMADEARHRAQQVGDQVRHSAEEAGHQVRHTAEKAGEQIRHGAEQMGHQAQQFGEQVSHQAQNLGQELGQQATQVGRQAQHRAMRAGDQMQRSLEEHPLTFGAVAFAAGAAIALILPQTRPENRMMGETREQLMESGQAVARDVAQRAQHVAEEVGPELQKTAQHVADDLRETGRQAFEDVQQTAQKAKEEAKQSMDKAQEEAKAEGEQAKEKAKQEASKVGETAKQEMSKAGDKPKAETGSQSTSTHGSHGSDKAKENQTQGT